MIVEESVILNIKVENYHNTNFYAIKIELLRKEMQNIIENNGEKEEVFRLSREIDQYISLLKHVIE